jgi:hypothetical protein
VLQRYLESNAAAGVILLSPFPPSPAPCLERLMLHPDITANSMTPLMPGRGSAQLEHARASHDFREAPQQIFQEIKDPANQVWLEPNSCRMLVMGSTEDSIVTEADMLATAEYHGVTEDAYIVEDFGGHGTMLNAQAPAVMQHMFDWIDSYY